MEVLELSSASHALNRTNDTLDPGKLPGVFADSAFNFPTIFVSPDPVLLGSQPIEMRVCQFMLAVIYVATRRLHIL